MPAEMTYQDAVNGAERSLSARKFSKADIFIARYDGKRFLIKDFGARGWLERNTIGRLLIWREHRAYTGLAGIKGLPGSYLRLSPFCLSVEYLDGRHFSSVERQEILPSTINQLEKIIDALHARGWVHLDLHRRKNLLLVEGHVYVIDLASAFHTGAFPLIGHVLTRIVGFSDRLAVVKFKAIFAPELLTSWEKQLVQLRNRLLRTPWEEQVTTARKERQLPQEHRIEDRHRCGTGNEKKGTS